jgi:hypothetical protein
MSVQRTDVCSRIITRVLRPQRTGSEYDEFCQVFFELDGTRLLEMGPDRSASSLRVLAEWDNSAFQEIECLKAASLAGDTIIDILVTEHSSFLSLKSGRVAWISDEEQGTTVEVVEKSRLFDTEYGYTPDDIVSFWAE